MRSPGFPVGVPSGSLASATEVPGTFYSLENSVQDYSALRRISLSKFADMLMDHFGPNFAAGLEVLVVISMLLPEYLTLCRVHLLSQLGNVLHIFGFALAREPFESWRLK